MQTHLIERARLLATVAHHGQLRKSTKRDFIKHPRQVAQILRLHGASDVAQCVGWLHDTLEDTTLPPELISKTCGSAVLAAVLKLTERKRDEAGAKRPWRTRKEEALAALHVLSREALEVRVADVLANFRELLCDVHRAGPSAGKVWSAFAVGRDETLWYFESMFRELPRHLRRTAGPDHAVRGWDEELISMLYALHGLRALEGAGSRPAHGE